MFNARVLRIALEWVYEINENGGFFFSRRIMQIPKKLLNSYNPQSSIHPFQIQCEVGHPSDTQTHNQSPPHSPMPLHRNCRRNGRNQATRGCPGRRIQPEDRANTVLDGVNLGDSIAVNGNCLTETQFDPNVSDFTVGLSPETLRKTSLMGLKPGSLVNLERAVTPTTRMGGHFVQGHVDGTGEIVSGNPKEDSLWVKVKTEKELLKYVVPKGFIAVDGTSLTVVDVFDEGGCFNFMLVAYTQQKAVIPLKKVGQKVNLEVDILAKYVERLLSSGFVDSIKNS